MIVDFPQKVPVWQFLIFLSQYHQVNPGTFKIHLKKEEDAGLLDYGPMNDKGLLDYGPQQDETNKDPLCKWNFYTRYSVKKIAAVHHQYLT